MAVTKFFPLDNPGLSFLGSMSMDFSSPGKVLPVPNHAKITNSSDLLHYPTSHPIVTKDTDGNPIPGSPRSRRWNV